MVAGEFEPAAQAYSTALELDPDYALSRANLALALIGLNRFDEADRVIQEGLARGQDSTGFHNRLFLISFLKGDSSAMQRHAEWFASRGDEYQMRETQARAFAFAGRRRQASEAFAQAAALAESRGLVSEKARILANEANLNAIFGLIRPAAEKMVVVLAMLEKELIGPEEMQPSLIGQLDSQPVAWTLALCGNAKRADAIAAGIARGFPFDTMQNAVYVPLTRATVELKSGSAGAAERAIQLLESARPYDAATFFKPLWLRGLAHLEARNGALAAAEFQKIIDHRGWDVLSPLWPLAHLGLARAAALQGDTERSRRAYENFSQLWKDADPDLPVVIAARREFEK
jgi:tetratricopeptide (TPR) repeat protein